MSARPRRRAFALAATVLAATLNAGAVSPAAADVPRLAGSTTFTAMRSSTITVRVPRPATLVLTNMAQSPDIEVSGAGRVAGVLLTAVDRPDPYQPATLVALQGGMCWEKGCHATEPRYAVEYTVADGLPTRTLERGTREITLAAGDYVVRAVTDGSPVRVHLRLRGLAGATTIRVTSPMALTLRTDESHDGVAGVAPLRNVAVTRTVRPDLSFMLDMMRLEYAPHVRSLDGVCYYFNRKPPTGMYHPGCPDAEYEFIGNVGYPTLAYHGAEIGSAFTLRGGEWTQAFYLTGVGGTSSLTVATLWIDL